MLKKLKYLPIIALAACQQVTAENFVNPGDPERQLTNITEFTTIALTPHEGIDRLKDSLSTSTPAQAKLNCPQINATCARAQNLLLKANIPLEIKGPTPSNTEETESTSQPEQTAENLPDNEVTLVYHRLAFTPCDNAYHDDSINNANAYHPSFGCSIRSNMVQSVTEKQQFVNPALLDYADGEKAAKNYQNYINPPAAATSQGETTSSLIGSASAPQ